MKKVIMILILALSTMGAWASDPHTQAHLEELRGDRFVSSSDGAIFDRQTGLKWMEMNQGETATYAEALAWVESLGEGWRLPTRRELKAIWFPESSRKNKMDKAFKTSDYRFWTRQRGYVPGHAVMGYKVVNMNLLTYGGAPAFAAQRTDRYAVIAVR